MPVKEFGIKRGNWGETFSILYKKNNLSDKSAKIYIQSKSGTMLVNGSDCVVSATDNNKRTLIEWTPPSGSFGSAASLSDYLVEITFSGVGFQHSTPTFKWQVYDELRG